MKTSFTLLAVALGSIAVAQNSHPSAGPKFRVLVSDAAVKVAVVAPKTTVAAWGTEDVIPVTYPPVPADLGAGVGLMLTTVLVESSRYHVLDTKTGAAYRLDPVVKAFHWDKDSLSESLLDDYRRDENGLTAFVEVDVDVVALDSGKIVRHVVGIGRSTGKFVQLSASNTVSSTAFQACPLGDALRNAVKDVVKHLNAPSAAMSWSAKLAVVRTEEGAESYFVNAGSESGVEVGMKFDVVRGDKPVGVVRVVSAQHGLASLSAVSGSGFATGDVLVLSK